MKSVYRFALALSVCLLLVTPFALQAQTTGTLEGTVTDQSGAALPGVTVELASPSLQGAKVVATEADGRYRFLSLNPGPYTVTATLTGFGKVQKKANVGLDAHSTVNFSLQLSASAEVVVTGEAPVVDTTTAESGLQINEATIQKLPLARNYASAVLIQPGVNQDLSETQGRGVTGGGMTIYGSTSVENQYLVDGVNTTNVVKGFQGKALNSEFIQEVQVKSGGYEAEYGRAMGGIINVITKSGGNEFHGDAFGYFSSAGLTANYKGDSQLVDDPSNSLNTGNTLNLGTDASYTIDRAARTTQDYGADLGGFMIKDHLWFFGAYNRVTFDQSQIPLADGAFPTSGDNLPYDSTANVYSGKLTVLLGQGTTLVGTVFGDPEERTGNLVNLSSTNPIIRQGSRALGAIDYGGSLTQLFGSSALVTARYFRHQDKYKLSPTALNNGVQTIDYAGALGPANLNGISYNGFGSIFGPTNNNNSTRDAYSLNGTVYAGNNEIKIGGDYEQSQTFTTSFYTPTPGTGNGGARFRIRPCPTSGNRRCPEGTPTFGSSAGPVYFQHDFYTNSTDPSQVVAAYLPNGNDANPTTDRIGAYIQDKITITPSLTASIGVRWDQEDVKDYTGATVFKISDEWQPRVGIAWDVAGDGTSKLAASFGFFYYAIPTDLNVRAYGAQTTAQTFNFSSDPYDFTPDLNAPRSTNIQGGPASEPVQAGIQGIYQQEYTLAYDKAIDPTFAVGVKGTFRYLGRTIEDRCDLDSAYPEANQNTCVILNPGSSSIFSTGDFHACLGPDYLDYSGNSPDSNCSSPQTFPISTCAVGELCTSPIPAAKRQYASVEFVAKKQIGREFWGQVSYIWSQLKGNYDGAARQANGGQTDPGINADYDYAAFLRNAYGRLYLDRPNSLRLDGAYTAPFGLTAGLTFFYRDGTPQNTLSYFNSQYGTEVFDQQRGYGGCAPSLNPGCNVAKRLPADYDINASLGYTIPINPVQISLFLQAFSLLNRQTPLDNDQELTVNSPGSPDAVNYDYHKVTVRRQPRALRFGARISF